MKHLDHDFFAFAFFRFALAHFDFRLSRRVVRECSSVSAQVNMVFFAKVVFVEQSASDALNADKKSAASWSLNFFRAQWCIPSTWFHDGNLPGISNRNAGVQAEYFSEFIAGHYFSLLKRVKDADKVLRFRAVKAIGRHVIQF
jgi:hypothetical protein